MDDRGDQGHFGPQFATWHAAIVLEFERALLSVDPSVGALPYWDSTLDDDDGVVFSDAYFGSVPGAGPADIVDDGRFAYWPVSSSFNLSEWAAYAAARYSSSTPPSVTEAARMARSDGYLRSADHALTTAYVTRRDAGDGSQTQPGALEYSRDAFWACATLDGWWEVRGASKRMHHAQLAHAIPCSSRGCAQDWYLCIESKTTTTGCNLFSGGSFHSQPHKLVGGVFDKPTGDYGDFKDSYTAVNDPIFMFHHGAPLPLLLPRPHSSSPPFPNVAANVDRSRQLWQYKNGNRAHALWGYPSTSTSYVGPSEGLETYHGSLLNDPISSQFPFSAYDLGLDVGLLYGGGDGDEAAEEPALTHADVLCWTSPAAAPYTYDDLAACFSDEPLAFATVDYTECASPPPPSPAPPPSPPPPLPLPSASSLPPTPPAEACPLENEKKAKKCKTKCSNKCKKAGATLCCGEAPPSECSLSTKNEKKCKKSVKKGKQCSKKCKKAASGCGFSCN